MNTLLKIGKWYWTIIFGGIILMEIMMIANHELLFHRSHISLLLFIILLFFHRNWLSWLFMVLLCVYGLYDLFVYATIASVATRMDFGFNTYFFCREKINIKPVPYLANLSPLLFYFFTLIFYFTKPVRKRYFNPDSLKHSSSL